MSDARRRAILDARAARLAEGRSAQSARKVLCDAAIVGVGGERFAIPSTSLRALSALPSTARVPGLRPFMLGIASLHGDLFTVIDLGAWLRIAGAGRPSYLALLDLPQGPLGLAVEAVLGFRQIHVDEIEQDAGGRGDGSRWAITRDLITILDPAALGESPDVLVGSGAR